MMQSQALQVLILVQVRLLHLQDELMKLWILYIDGFAPKHQLTDTLHQ